MNLLFHAFRFEYGEYSIRFENAFLNSEVLARHRALQAIIAGKKQPTIAGEGCPVEIGGVVLLDDIECYLPVPAHVQIMCGT